ncbi:histone-lysine N-methyltransferase [Aphelenchoides avenae]|nr:histone-lysine N-methyltransferase [Aphelenchus avenae]
MIAELNLRPNDAFVDLGSGVGQIVTQVAAGSSVKLSIGIELADLQSKQARDLNKTFQVRLLASGARWNAYELRLETDVLDDSVRDLILKDATVLLINNLAFPATLNEKIKQELISKMANGTRIVTTKKVTSRLQTVNAHNAKDVCSILRTTELKPCSLPATSWTANHVPYYLHTVDRSKRDEALAAMMAASQGRKRKSKDRLAPEKKKQRLDGTA